MDQTIPLFAARGRRLTRRGWLIAAVRLLFPPVGAIATRFIPEVGKATLAVVATALAVAVVNATMEELLWRPATTPIAANARRR